MQELINHEGNSAADSEQPVLVGELPDVLPEDNHDLAMELLVLVMLYAEMGKVEEGQEGYQGEFEAPMENF